MTKLHRINKSHGTGKFRRKDFCRLGKNVIFEKGVLVFHPENIEIGENVYIGHNTFLKGYYKNSMLIGNHTWIGQQCFLHSAGGLQIGRAVGIGPQVIILTSQHKDIANKEMPVYLSALKFSKVVIKDRCDIGAGAVILPGVKIGEGAIIGAGAVVTKDISPYEIWVGNPARFLKKRKGLN